MGLFNRNKNKVDKEIENINKRKEQILTEGRVVLNLAVGTYGADQIVAGAMMGETGKLIGMAKYGKTKWQPTFVNLFDNGIIIQYTRDELTYDTIIGCEIINSSWLDHEFLLHTTYGDLLFKTSKEGYEAFNQVLNEFKESYVKPTINEDNKDVESNMDRLIRLGELHERGLLSDEEFAEAKEININKNKNNKIIMVLNKLELSDELLILKSYVEISTYRTRVINSLVSDAKMPSQIAKETGILQNHMSNTLRQLREHGLIECINPEVKKGRLYRLTDKGEEIFK